MPITRPVGLAVLTVVLCAGCMRRDDTVTMAVALLPSELPVYRQVLGGFERQTGHIVRVVAQQYPEIRRALAAETAGGYGTLDLVELDVFNLASVAGEVAVLDEHELAAELGSLDAASLAAGRIRGLRFVPHRVSWQALLYDHAVLGRPPQTWADVLAVARRYPHRIGLKGALSEGLTCDVLPFVWSAGGSGDRFDDDGARAAFEFFAKLAPYLHPDSATFKEATIAEAMARGEIVLHLNWPFAMSLYASQGLAPERLRSAPMPRSPSGRRATVLGGGYLAVPRNAPHRDAAVELLRFLMSATTQREFREKLGWFSPRGDVDVGDGDVLLAGFAEMRNEVRPRSPRSDYPRRSRLWQRAFRAVVFGHVDPAVALADASADIGEQASALQPVQQPRRQSARRPLQKDRSR